MEQQIRECLGEGQPREAFERLVETFQHRVYHVALAILGDPALAEDAAQEAFIRIWRGLPRFRGESSLGTWIYAIARHTSLSVRAASRSRAVESLDDDAVLAASENRRRESVSPARAGFDVAALVGELRPQYRQVVRLFYMEDRSYEEVSRLLGIPLGTVKTILYRARMELAAALARSTVKDG